ncbi:hypothetical protein BDV12DRAFT_202230 [Aspergillus spectabilis]
MSNNSYPKDESWILIPKKQGLLYKEFMGAPGTVSLWVADVYIEEHFAEEHQLLKRITSPKEHIYNTVIYMHQWAIIGSGQNWTTDSNLGRTKTSPLLPSAGSSITLQPGSQNRRISDRAPLPALTSTGLKIADPSGILNAGAANLVGWDNLKTQLLSIVNSFGDPLRRFGQTGLTEAQEKEELDNEAALNLARSDVEKNSKTSGLPEIQKEVLSHVIVALHLGVQGVAEEGPHHAS